MPMLSRLPRPIRVLLMLLVAYALIYALGFGATAVHYATTPTFEEFVATHPVDDAEVRASSVGGTPIDPAALAVGETELLAGGVESVKCYDYEVRIEVTRGEESVCSVRSVVRVALDAATYRKRAVEVRVPDVRTAEGLRARVTLRLNDVRVLGEASSRTGDFLVELVLASGEGEDDVRFVAADGTEPAMDPGVSPLGDLGVAAIGLLHPLGGPPDSGLVYHVRAQCGVGAYNDGDRSSLGWTSESETSVNSNEYSWAIRTEHRLVDENGVPRQTSSFELSRRYEWNGELW